MRLNRSLARMAVGFALLALGACAQTELAIHAAKTIGGTPGTDDTAGGRYKVGDPYQVGGVWYFPKADYAYEETGIASWYGPDFHGNRTANGERYDMNALTAAHKTLPLPSIVQVTNLENGRTIRLRVNDRGPFVNGRIIDVSRRAAQLLGFYGPGTAKVRVKILAPESMALAASAGRLVVADARPEVRQVDRAPRLPVARESLPSAPDRTAPAGVERAAASPRAGAAPRDGEADGAPMLPPERLPEVVTVEPVKATQMFVQAGAFTEYGNAARLKALLSRVGPTLVTDAQVSGNNFFRVRVGPLARVEDADAMLERIIRAGFHDARIVVD